MAIKTSKFDAADYLTSPADIEAYLEAALEENDPAFFQKALGTVARAQGMQAVADKSKATRAGLYKALSTEGNPEFATVYRVIGALGYRLTLEKVVRASKPAAKKRPAPKTAAVKKTSARVQQRV
ncbi:addiction module antidote protein [Lysobacter koreensis]|uniref:Addiction module antidote protein n=1 Tax=Lysobacter koreensis TaxID=266122 RepID=A0ABW2YP91_9GAMM